MRRKKIKVLLLVVMVLLLGIAIVLNRYHIQVTQIFNEDEITLAPMDEAIAINSQDHFYFDTYKGDLLVSNKDGIKRMDVTGKVIWDQPFSMLNPKISVKDNYIFVIDVGGTEFYIFNEDGMVYKNKTNNPIILSDLNSSGNVGIIEENRDAHILTVFNEEGQPIFKRNTTINNAGYPTDLALSSKGHQLVVSYLDINGIKPKSNLVFFDLYDRNIYTTDQITNAIEWEEDIIADIINIDKENYIVLSATQVKGYKFNDCGTEIFSINNTNKIIDLKATQDFIAIAYGEPLAGFDQDLSEQLILYDKIGNNINNFNIEGRLTYLCKKDNSLIVGNNRSYISIQKNGKVNWRYDAKVDIKQLIPLSSNYVLVVWEDNYQIFEKVRLY